MEILAPTFALMPNLANLYLQGNEFTSRGIRALCRTPPTAELGSLFMWHNKFDGAALDAIGDAVHQGRMKLGKHTVIVAHTNHCSGPSKDRLRDVCDLYKATCSL